MGGCSGAQWFCAAVAAAAAGLSLCPCPSPCLAVAADAADHAAGYRPTPLSCLICVTGETGGQRTNVSWKKETDKVKTGKSANLTPALPNHLLLALNVNGLRVLLTRRPGALASIFLHLAPLLPLLVCSLALFFAVDERVVWMVLARILGHIQYE